MRYIMKYSILIAYLVVGSCQPKAPQTGPQDDWLKKYSQHSLRTDPGDYAFLYKNLPQSLDSLCRLINCQLIHPLEASQMNLELEEFSQDGDTPTAGDLLELLLSTDSAGLSYVRGIPNRSVVACYHHAMLLASILRHQGIPVRMRAGFSKYYEKQSGVRFGHIICEVWDDKTHSWKLVDPDRELVDMSDRDFDFAYEAWNNVNKKRTNAQIYTSSISEGVKGIINLMILDAALIIKEEKLYWDLPEIVFHEIYSLKDLNKEEINILNELADYCRIPDVWMNEISEIYQTCDYFQPSGIEYDDYVEIILDRN